GGLRSSERESFAAKRKRKKDLLHQHHDVPPATDGRQRKPVRQALAESSEVGLDPEQLLGASLRKAKARDSFVEYQQRAMLCAKLPNAFKITGFRKSNVHRFQDYASDLAFVLLQQRCQRRLFVVCKRMRQSSCRLRHAAIARRRANEPVLPAVIATNKD